MSGRLKLRRGVVVDTDPLTVEVDGERRPAWADEELLGEMREGDEVVVNVTALDLGLGSGGFDVVHVNLTRGLEGGGEGREHVMKLNYSSLQHPVEPVERPLEEAGVGASVPVLVLPLHGHLAPAAWAAAETSPGIRVGYVQTGGGALPGGFSRDAAQLLERGLLCDHITAAPAYGGRGEAISVAGAHRRRRQPVRLGRRPRRPRAGDHRLGDPAGPRRDRGARHGPCGARAGDADPALAAPLERR